jgi:hypothetical protein
MQNLQLPQDGSSLLDFLRQDIWNEHFQLQMGIVPATTVNKLFRIAYQLPWVKRVNIAVHRDPNVENALPSFEYQVEIKQKVRYGLAAWGARRGGILGRLVQLVMVKLGAPLGIDAYIQNAAYSYLPAGYVVWVRVFCTELKPLKPQPDQTLVKLA